MLRFFTFIVLTVLALFLEGTWLFAWPTDWLRFELVWILVLYLGFSTTIQEGGGLVLLMALLEDLGATPFLGFLTTSYFVLFILLRAFIANMYLETLWARLLWVGVLSVLLNLAEWGLISALGYETELRTFFFAYGFLQCLVNMGIAALLFPLLDRLENFLYPPRHAA